MKMFVENCPGWLRTEINQVELAPPGTITSQLAVVSGGAALGDPTSVTCNGLYCLHTGPGVREQVKSISDRDCHLWNSFQLKRIV